MTRLYGILLLAATLHAQEWTDRAEYDLALAVRSQAAPAERLSLLSQWREKYPNSALKPLRAELTLTAAQAVGDTTTMLAAAREIVAGDPGNMAGLYWLAVLGPGAKDGGDALLNEIAAACKRLLEGLGKEVKSAPGERVRVEALARRTMGWTEWRRGDFAAAEASLNRSLELDPEDGLSSAWLGAVLTAQRAPEKQPSAIWHLARAAYLDGEGALPSGQRQELRGLLEATYVSYHGEMGGLEQIGESARASAQPAANFKVESAAELILRRHDEELSRTNPELLNWLKMRRGLQGADADGFFQKLVGVPTPKLKAYVVRCNSQSRATEVVVGMTEPSAEEALLKFEASAGKCPDAGTEILFEGTPSTFSKEPFLMTIQVARQGVENWPSAKPGR